MFICVADLHAQTAASARPIGAPAKIDTRGIPITSTPVADAQPKGETEASFPSRPAGAPDLSVQLTPNSISEITVAASPLGNDRTPRSLDSAREQRTSPQK